MFLVVVRWTLCQTPRAITPDRPRRPRFGPVTLALRGPRLPVRIPGGRTPRTNEFRGAPGGYGAAKPIEIRASGVSPEFDENAGNSAFAQVAA